MTLETRQRVFYAWFVVLSVIAVFNFMHNLSDANSQDILIKNYTDNKDRYERYFTEHEDFKHRLSYLEGKTSGLCKETK